MKSLIKLCVYWLQRFLPKRDYAVIWCWPDGEDSGIVLEQALQSRRISRIILLTSHPNIPASWQVGGKTIRARKNTVSGVFWFLTARYIFFTHPCFTRKYPPNVISVNMWHGMPIKKIGSMLPDDKEMACSHTIVTSPFWGNIMQRAMNPRGALPDLGLPRNDRLFSDELPTRNKIQLKDGQKLLVWLPTYRKSARGLARNDGFYAGNIFEMPDINPDHFNEWLASHEMVMIVKAHPMAEQYGQKDYSHLRIIDQKWLNERCLSLYQLLGASHCLLSDVSSVVIDYLLLDRPIIHTFHDINAYNESRGFTVEPIEEYLAGPLVANYAQLLSALEAISDGDDPMAKRRETLLRLSHTHYDAMATERLLQLIGLGEISE